MANYDQGDSVASWLAWLHRNIRVGDRVRLTFNVDGEATGVVVGLPRAGLELRNIGWCWAGDIAVVEFLHRVPR
jgi:hypothetical protein